MREHYGEWVADVEQRGQGHADAIRKLVDKLRGEFTGLEVDRVLLRALRNFHGDPSSWDYRPPNPGRLARRQEKAAAYQASITSLQPNSPVERDPDALTVALLMLVEEQP